MANGQTTGAHGRSRRNSLSRISSPQGRAARQQRRAAAKPVTADKYRGGFKRAGSGNPRKVGRG
jgi:hypothetical protein